MSVLNVKLQLKHWAQLNKTASGMVCKKHSGKKQAPI